MASVWHTFQMAGWSAYVCLLLAIIGIPLTLLAVLLVLIRVRAARMVAVLVVCFGALAPAFGAFGMWRGRTMVDQVLESGAVDPAMKARIREQGYYEAEQALYVGLVCGALPLVLGSLALGLSFVIPPRKPDAAAATKS